MTRENIRALVTLGAPVYADEVRAIREHPEVTRVETTPTTGGGYYLDAVHFAPPGPQSYPDAITNPVDPPTVDGTSITRPFS